MTQQPEALRLASELEIHAVYLLSNWSTKAKEAKDAAAELRRLHAENERLNNIIKCYEALDAAKQNI